MRQAPSTSPCPSLDLLQEPETCVSTSPRGSQGPVAPAHTFQARWLLSLPLLPSPENSLS